MEVQEVEHTADLSIRVHGQDLPTLFANAARGMFALMTDLERVRPIEQRQVDLEAFDVETLLVAWLSELLWLSEESGLYFNRFQIASLTPTRLNATAWGGPADQVFGHIKAVTFNNLRITSTETGYEVTIVFDV